jgi:2-polyprenyl-3-methyl-5-hydroxy-6-metoxy-1,4-benzoquinol methylase
MSEESWNSRAADWNDDPDVVLYAHKSFQTCEQFVFPLVPNMAAASVLDFGCGTGLLTEKLSHLVANVDAVDTSQGMIDILLRKIGALNLENVTATSADILDSETSIHQKSRGRFDLITASSVCSFLPDYQHAMARLSSFLKPGGAFVQWDWAADMPRQKIQAAFHVAGLQIEHCEIEFEMTFGGDVYPVIMAVGRKIPSP